MSRDVSTSKTVFRMARVAVVIFLVIVATWAVLVRERWTKSTTEFKTVMKYCRVLQQLEQRHLSVFGRYGDLEELRNLRGERLVQALPATDCDPQYCIAITADERDYSIRVFPNATSSSRRHLSIYVDRSGSIRVAYGEPRAGPTSRVLSSVDVARLEKP